MARLLLLPGLGADERLFGTLGALGRPMHSLRLPEPRRHESMTAYAMRVAAQLELRPADWIGGASFGGLVAADIARRRPVAGLVLIGGALSSETMITAVRWLGRLGARLPMPPLYRLLSSRALLARALGVRSVPLLHQLTDMAAATPAALWREGARLATGYFPHIPVLCPVRAIHGAADRIMRPPPIDGCRLVPAAGHALALTHAPEVTDFLREVLSG